MNRLKNLVLVLLLITASIFIGISSAKAADSIKISKVIAGNGINFRTTTDGVAVYSIGSTNPGPKKGDKLNLHTIYNKGYYLYILNDKNIAGSEVSKARTIRQKALWKIRGYKISGTYIEEANRLASAAKKAGANYSISPSVTSVTSPSEFSRNGDYYFSNKIYVKLSGVTDKNYKVTFSGAPSGTIVVNKSNSSFQIRVPANSVKNNIKFRVKVTGTLSPYKYVKQYHKDSKTDDVAILYSTFKAPSKTVVASLYPNGSSSTETGSTDGNYKVTLYIVSGKTHNVVDVKSGNKMTKPIDPTRKGYRFVGWYTDDTYQVKYNFNDPVTSNLDLYAKWELVEYTITYNSNGGSSVKDSKVYYNQEIKKPNDPTRSGYYFAGWYKDSNFSNKFSFLTNVTSDITLYAKWVTEKPNTHDVTFVSGFNTDPIIVEVEDGDTVTAPITTNSESNNLAGWYTDTGKQNEYDFSSPVTKDITLYAKWLSASGEEMLETPDTASPARVIVIIGGIILFAGGSIIIYRQYGKDFFKRQSKVNK